MVSSRGRAGNSGQQQKLETAGAGVWLGEARVEKLLRSPTTTRRSNGREK